MVEELQKLDEEKESLAVQVMILEGEKNDFEAATNELKSKQLATEQQVQELKLKVDELENENGGLTKRLETANNRRLEFRSFCYEACKVIEQMYNLQADILEKVYSLKQMMVRMDEIVVEAQAARQWQFNVAEKVERNMVWRETNSEYPAELVPKTLLDLKSEMQLLEFCRKAFVKLSTDITRTAEACMGFYKKIQKVYEKCHLAMLPPIDDLPAEELQMAEIKNLLQGELEYIRKFETFTEEDVHDMVGQASIHVYLLETQLSYHEVSLQVLEPSRISTIAEEANAWDKFFPSYF